ncbi:MAG: hypothetical protein IJA10_10545 [Lachnospiraceae bacterium]|nr:hypothetical protein [Lachnospiraceae bacterium]
MENKLIYEKYKGLDNIITIDLHNDYTIIAISSQDKETNYYNVELHLKENTVDEWKLIEKAENLVFKVNEKRLNAAILKKVAKLLNNGFFDYYIDRYEYELKCFDVGNDICEKERLEGDVL